jgi:hypothetical protein
MRWNFLCGDSLRGFLNEKDEVKNTKSVEVIFDDGESTGVLVELENGDLIHFCSRETEHDGCRKSLSVSTTKGDE